MTFTRRSLFGLCAGAAAAPLFAATRKLPHFATGSWSVPQDMVAQVHAGEMITPSPRDEILEIARVTRNIAANAVVNNRYRELNEVHFDDYRRAAEVCSRLLGMPPRDEKCGAS